MDDQKREQKEEEEIETWESKGKGAAKGRSSASRRRWPDHEAKGEELRRQDDRRDEKRKETGGAKRTGTREKPEWLRGREA